MNKLRRTNCLKAIIELQTEIKDELLKRKQLDVRIASLQGVISAIETLLSTLDS